MLLTKFCQWLISVDASASDMRLVGLVELFVAFRIHEGGSPLCVSGGHSDRYSLVSFARDFSYFKKLLKQFADCTCISRVYGQVDLTLVGILPIQCALWLGWPKEIEGPVLKALKEFVGNRPITHCQGFSRPWHL